MLRTEEVVGLLKQFNSISGFHVSIYDKDFNKIYTSNENPGQYCSFLREDPDVLHSCNQSDLYALKKAKEMGSAYMYKCPQHLFEVAVPIYCYGELSGFLFMGRVGEDTAESREKLLLNIKSRLGDDKMAKNIVNSLNFIDANNLPDCVGIMTIVAKHIVEENLLNSVRIALPTLVKEYLDANYSSKITIDALSRRFACSKTTLQKGFYSMYGVSIITYLREVRINQAKKLLAESDKNIREVANGCGFDDQNYFSRVFAASENCSPKEYRMKKRKQNKISQE